MILHKLTNGDGKAHVKQGDTILFFYAGHMDWAHDPLEQGPEVEGRYLVTVNAKKDSLPVTAVKRDRLERALRNSPAAKCLVFLDTCYSGGNRIRTISDQEARAPKFRSRRLPLDPGFHGSTKPSRAQEKVGIFAAADKGQVAAEDPKYKHGVFTYALLEGLRGKANINTDQEVSLDELVRYLKKTIPSITKGIQNPYIDYPQNERFESTSWRIIGR